MFMDSNNNFKYTIYKTTNNINGKVYIGCHKTLTPNDGYLGSGTILKRAIKKYGRENFTKEILFVFDNSEEMFLKEGEIVDKVFIETEKSYNLLIGGFGGFGYINSTCKNLYGENGNNGKEALKLGRKVFKEMVESGKIDIDKWKQTVSDGLKKKYSRDGFHWTGRKHKESTKKKIGKKLSIAQTGRKNSQYGTCWVYCSVENRKIKKSDIESFLCQGWKRGRKYRSMV
jgi:hypothetical protein